MTFKINWEKMHIRTPLPDEVILKMLAVHYPKNDIKSIAVISGGCANINVLVHLKSSNIPVILRVYLRDQESAYKEQKISELLVEKLPVPKIYHITENFGYTFAIVKYLKGTPLRDFLLSNHKVNIADIMFKVGKVLGAISSIKFPQPGFFDKNLQVIPNTDELEDFCFSCLQDTKVKAALIPKEINSIKHAFTDNQKLLQDTQGTNLVHADFDPSNILVVENAGKLEISGILDWEFAFSGSTLWDIANTTRYAHQMPHSYKTSFLEGLCSSGYQLPDSWQIKVNLLNILSLLDSLQRTQINDRPNQIKDIKELINYFLTSLK